VTQTAEYYRGKPVVYSLGNFVFDGFDTPLTRTGWILELELEKSGVRRFRTRVVHLDDDGAPVLDPDVPSPCGERGVVRTCSGR
jgi:poly-gamma-glutamate synthesis protein (capsule biosynthesis protein)